MNWLFCTDFNPRSRKGFDEDTDPWAMLKTISIHEAAKASTRWNGPLKRRNTYFNPRSRKGFDQVPLEKMIEAKDFNPRSRKGFDLFYFIGNGYYKPFQSTKPQRLRQQKHPKNNLIFKNNLYTYYNIPAHNNYILIILNLFTIKSTIFQVRISRDFHVHFLFAPNNSILKYHN